MKYRIIRKAELTLQSTQRISVPKGAKFLTVNTQCGIPYIWYECSPDQRPTDRTIFTFQPEIQLEGKYVGTIFSDEEIAYHIFEQVEAYIP